MIDFDERAFRNTMGKFCTGVVIAAGSFDGSPVGFAAQSFASLSLDPPLVALCPAKSSTSWPKLRSSGAFCINILAADQKSVCDAMAQSGGDKFSQFLWHAGESGSPILEGVLAYIDCQIEAEHDAGDHTIVVGRVCDFKVSGEHDNGPLVFYQGSYGEFAGL